MKPVAMSADDKKWEIEQDLRALQRAEEIKKDTKRMAAVKALAKEKLDELKAITQ